MPRCEIGTIVVKDKTHPQIQSQSHVAPCNSFYGHTLKAHLPIYQSLSAKNTCTLDAKNSAQIETRDVLSKYQLDQDVWVKVDPHTKWMAGKIVKFCLTKAM